MTPTYQNIQLHENLRAGLRTIAAFDGKTERDILHDIITSGIHSRMETISREWLMDAEKEEPILSEEDCLFG